MSKSPKVILHTKNGTTEVSAKTAEKAAAETIRRQEAIDRKSGNGK